MLWDLQDCITEPARIIHNCSRAIVRRLLLFNRGTGRERAGTGDETLNAPVKGTGTAEKESPPADDDENYNQQQDFDHGEIDYYDGECEIIDIDEADDGTSDEGEDGDNDISDDAIDREWPPPGLRITYDGDSPKLRLAYMFSRNLVELLAVYPRFKFVGTFAAFGAERLSLYYCSSERGKIYRNVDSQGNLILHAEGTALRDRFNIEIKIPEDDDAGRLSFTVDPYACNRVITRTISTRRSRKIDVTFMALHAAIQANVEVTFDLISGSATSTTSYYVYGEITARHQLYGDEQVMLFSRREKDKVEAINGILPMSRNWAAVPIYLEPLLMIKLNLFVSTNHDGDSPMISFRDDITFYRDRYEKILSSADHHGEVKVRISYR